MTISDAYEHEPSAPNFPRIYADKPFNYSFYRRLEGNKKDYTVKDIDYTDYEEDIWVGYRYFQTKAPRHVAYPFGYGLSYTTFKWSGLKVAAADGGYRVCVTVRNTGKVAGKDVVQLYVKAPGREMVKPARELKAFAKTPLLQPGESCTVEMFVSAESLASWDEKSSSWSVEKGRYRFIAARNAADRGLSRRIRFQ